MRAGLASWVCAALLAAPTIGQAAGGLNVSAALSDRSVGVGDVVTLEVHVVAEVDGNLDVQINPVDGLSELSRSRSEGTSISWSNAGQKMTRETTLSIELQPEHPGKFTIPPVLARVGTLSARSEPLQLEVGGDAAPETLQSVGPNEIAPPEPGERDLFVRYRVSKPEAFLGEQILLDLEIMVDPGAGFSISDTIAPPELDGFWREILEQPQRLNRRMERVANRNYHAYRVWRLGLFGLEAGERTIEPAALTFTQGQTIFGGGRRTRRRSLPLKITVKPLPTEGRPADFANTNVGHYELKASVDHDKVPAGKAVLLTISLEGSGNLKSVKLPTLESAPGFRLFPPTMKDDIQVTPAGVKGAKRAEILLMPEVGGRLEIPSLSLSTFDPDTAQYKRLTTPSLRVVVEGTPVPALELPTVSGTASPEAPTQVAKESLRPLHYRSRLSPRDRPAFVRPELYGAYLLPPSLFGLMLLAGVVRARVRQQTPASKRRAAKRSAALRLAAAASALEAGESADAHARFAEAVLEFGAEKCGLVLRGLTSEQLQASLLARGAPSDLVQRLIAALVEADYARFAPGLSSSADRSKKLEDWQSLLADLDAFEPEEPSP